MNVIKWRRRPKKINLLWKNGINSNTPTMSEKISISSSLISLTHLQAALIMQQKAPPPQIKRVGLTVEETLTEKSLVYFISFKQVAKLISVSL